MRVPILPVAPAGVLSWDIAALGATSRVKVPVVRGVAASTTGCPADLLRRLGGWCIAAPVGVIRRLVLGLHVVLLTRRRRTTLCSQLVSQISDLLGQAAEPFFEEDDPFDQRHKVYRAEGSTEPLWPALRPSLSGSRRLSRSLSGSRRLSRVHPGIHCVVGWLGRSGRHLLGLMGCREDSGYGR